VPPLDTIVVQIDLDPLELGRSYANLVALNGDPKTVLAQLSAAIGKPTRDRVFADDCAALVAGWRAEMAPLLASDASPIRVERLCAEITRALPPNGILVADTGYSGIWTGTLIELDGVGQSYLRAAGSLGWSFPAALGAKCAAPDRKVLCFTGDGGFYYHLAELETARRRGIAVTVVVNNNSGFGQSLAGVRRILGNRAGPAEELVCFGPTDFTAVARSFGVRGIRVEQPGALAGALADALSANEPVVVDVITDIEPRAPEPWVPGVTP
jgi:acetolactate synthase-1/2/3 large subunit